MTFEELHPGLLVRIMSKAEPGPKYFLCVRINADVEVVTFMYVSTDEDEARPRYNCPIESKRLPFEESAAEWSAFSFNQLPRYRKDDFEARFLKAYGLVADAVVVDLRAFCDRNKSDIDADEYERCTVLFDALVPRASKPTKQAVPRRRAKR